jgi:anti-sigma factor ChrR (cupin superfamily)
MAPGAVYPAHRHAGPEHCYVLEGDLVFEDHVLNAGDYEVAAPSSDHSFVTTTRGCLLLLFSHVNDQLLPA